MKTAIIIGAGPAGLTAAYEFLQQTDIVPIIIEATPDIGGISKTVNYKGNRIDIGGHRFFSKSSRVMNWWLNILPLEKNVDGLVLSYQNRQTHISSRHENDSDKDEVMLIRSRLSRIYYLKKFFNYPLKLNGETLRNLGLVRIIRIGLSYLKSKIFPIRNEVSLEDFFINRFGRELYKTFFKDYTEKVWGVSCNEISAEWGAQRVKGLSLRKTITNAIFNKKDKTISQKNKETSLIENFLYPKYGPGQLWELVAKKIEAAGGKILFNREVNKIIVEKNKVVAVSTFNKDGVEEKFEGDYFISTMPVINLINGLSCTVPEEVKTVANGLVYRAFITVGLLMKKLSIKNPDGTAIKDNWIYIQEKTVMAGRLQIFNNWSQAMVKDPDTIWMGLEYFCNEEDAIWKMSDEEIIELVKKEAELIRFIDAKDVLDAVVIRMPKTYPSYVGAYNQFELIRNYTDQFSNLFLIGRNGMHKYNNQDHSMLTAMQAVENIKNGVTGKENIWSINTEDEYHED